MKRMQKGMASSGPLLKNKNNFFSQFVLKMTSPAAISLFS